MNSNERICERCKLKRAVYIQEPEPYEEDINGIIKLVDYCEECWQESIADI